MYKKTTKKQQQQQQQQQQKTKTKQQQQTKQNKKLERQLSPPYCQMILEKSHNEHTTTLVIGVTPLVNTCLGNVFIILFVNFRISYFFY